MTTTKPNWFERFRAAAKSSERKFMFYAGCGLIVGGLWHMYPPLAAIVTGAAFAITAAAEA